jgi:hypothetical protein
MRSIVTVTTPATSIMLCTADDLKTELGVTTDDNNRFFRLIRAASQQIFRYLGRTIIQETVSETIRADDCDSGTEYLNLDRYPVIAIASVTEDGKALAPSDYECDQESGQLFRLSNDRRVCWRAAKVTIVYQGGYVLQGQSGANMPADIAEAALRLAAQSYSPPDTEPGLRAIVVPGVVEKQFYDQSAAGEESGSISPDIRAILDPYRRMTLL